MSILAPECAKRDILESLLAAYPVVRVILDRTVKGVVYPAQLDDIVQAIDIGYSLNTPIPDLTLDELGVTATLSFRGARIWCMVPWAAIFCVCPNTGDAEADAAQNVLWPESVPQHLVQRAIEANHAPPPPPAEAAALPENVIALDTHRSPKDMHAVRMRRLGLTPQAPAPIGPGGGSAA